jgi:hypothetical protein
MPSDSLLHMPCSLSFLRPVAVVEDPLLTLDGLVFERHWEQRIVASMSQQCSWIGNVLPQNFEAFEGCSTAQMICL